MRSGPLTVAAVQMESGEDLSRNVRSALALVHHAADQGATYVQLPEYFNFLGPGRQFSSVAESVPGPTTERLGAAARGRAITVHLGSMLETSLEPGKCYNTSVVLGESGNIVAVYRKAHLFDVAVPDAVFQRESDAVVAGEQLVVARMGPLRLGLSVCFDLRFGELYRTLALSGANVFAVPAAFNAVTGEAHWATLVRARAIENHAYVVAAAQVGVTAAGIATFGHSMIVGPWGEVLGESAARGEDVVVASIDLDEVARRRQQIAVLDLRRPALYDVTKVTTRTSDE